jgi:two-component system sensor histidine kinase MprB
VGFRARLALVIAVLVAASAAVVALLALQTARQQVVAAVDRSLVSVVDDLENGPGPGVGAGLRGRRAEDLVVQLHPADGGAVRVLGDDAPLPVPDAIVAAAADGPIPPQTVRLDGEPVRLVARPVPSGVLVVGLAIGAEQALLAALLARYLLIGVAVSALAAGVGWLVAGRLVAPLGRLTAAAERVATTGDLDVDVRTDDADEAGRLSRAFDDMLAALAASRAQQQRLVDDAGHELRTPIASIRSNAEVLQRHPTLDAETRRQIADDLIAESAELTALVGSLVELAGARGADEPSTEVAVGALVADAVRRLPPADRDRVHIQGEAMARLRPAQVQRAVVNLLTNAVKFDPTGAPIDVTIGAADGWVTVTVRDHGPGIAPADLPHIFDRFYRADTARATPGSGLGLAIVADVVAAHGGTVAATSPPEGGAALTLRLPAAGNSGEGTAAAGTPAQGPAAGAPIDLSGR